MLENGARGSIVKTALITGVSSGIGYALARELLDNDFTVYGISRRTPKELFKYNKFHHLCADLSDLENVPNKLHQFLITDSDISKFNYVFLNAGEFNRRISLICDSPVHEYDYLMHLNVWSYKIVLDVLLRANQLIEIVIFSSSIAGLRARKGMGAYAITKSALNMMAKLYALDYPDIFFSVLGLCNVDTFLSDNILHLPLMGEFPEMEKLRERAKNPGYLVSPSQRAEQILKLLELNLREKSTSGDFVEIRQLLETEQRNL